MRRMADLAAEGRLASDGAGRCCGRSSSGFAGARVRVFGDVLEMTLSDLTAHAVPAGRGPASWKEETHEERIIGHTGWRSLP